MNVVVGTRGSLLATTQTNLVVDLLRSRRPDITFSLRTIRTEGDIRADRPLSEIGGKGVFVKELETALQRGEIDIAVHSLKDVPAAIPDDLVIAATLEREDPRDVLISRDGVPLSSLKEHAKVATGSQRREVQLRAVRPDLTVMPIRGNVDTRLRKLREGQYDALILAAAGLKRLGKVDEVTEFLEPDIMVPSVGQGVLAVQCRAQSPLLPIVSALDHPATGVAVTAERAFLSRLGAGCELPVGAYARVHDMEIIIDGMLAREDGTFVRSRLTGRTGQAAELGVNLAEELLGRMAEVRV